MWKFLAEVTVNWELARKKQCLGDVYHEYLPATHHHLCQLLLGSLHFHMIKEQ